MWEEVVLISSTCTAAFISGAFEAELMSASTSHFVASRYFHPECFVGWSFLYPDLALGTLRESHPPEFLIVYSIIPLLN
jgi:hypothetical protein